jgi:glycosyltransferase involved in cell wall biosynthesis
MRHFRVMALPNSSGASVWRLIDPFKYLNSKGYTAEISKGGFIEESLKSFDIVVLQSIVDKDCIATLRAWQQTRGLKIVCDVDDYGELNPDNPFKKDHEVTDAAFVIGKTLEIADMITTTTPYLAKKLEKINPNVTILPNYMDLHRWEKDSRINNLQTINIGWVGSITHMKDLEIIIEPLSKLMRRYPIKFLTMGDTRIKNLFEEDLQRHIEVSLGVPFEYYPQKLAGMGIDIGLAPLDDNSFNKCKSNIKCLEYGINSIPCVTSDTEPYKSIGKLEVGVFNAKSSGDWYDTLEYLIKNETDRLTYGKDLHNHVKNEYNLEVHICKWIKAYQSL